MRTLRSRASARLVGIARVTGGDPQRFGDPLRPELGDEHSTGDAVAVARVSGLCRRRRPPALGGAKVQLVLEDDEAGPLEERDPLERRALQVPAEILALTGRDAEEEPSVARQHTVQLSERALVTVLVRSGVDAVHGVVAPDVLERRDADREIEAATLEREVAHVGDDVGRLGEIDGDEVMRVERPEPLEVRGDRVRRPDVEDTPSATTGEAPWDLDRTLVAPRRCVQRARPAAPRSLARREGEPVVEQLDALELTALDELAHEPRSRDLTALEAAQRLRRRRAAEHKSPDLLDEIVHEAEARVTAMSLQGKRIVITGGAGFIATTLARLLVDGNEVVAYDNLHRDALGATDLREHPGFTFVQGDVLDAEHVAEVAQGATHIVHCAAIAGVDTVRESPVRTMRVNMIGTYNVLEAALGTLDTLERIVDFSTSEVFGTHADNVHEGHVSTIGSVGEARWTYAVSKLAGEHMAHAYHDELRLPTVTVRPFNVYGPGQIGGGAIRAFIEAALAGRDLTIHGDGSQVRAWCYVDDMVDAVLLCLERAEAVGQSFNIGNDRSTVTILDLAQRIKRLTGCSGEIVFTPLTYVDIEVRSPNVARARELLGFEANVDLDEGLERTIAWYRSRQLTSA
jgi:UDP-glucose 4-epimerase